METTKKKNDKKGPTKIKNIALSGGGPKGLAFIGSFRALMDYDLLDLKRLSGSSVGSLMGLLYVLKYSPEELYSFITSFNYEDVKSLNFIGLFEQWGIETGEKIMTFFGLLIKRKLNKTDITFQDLYDYNKIEFTVVVTHLNKHETIYFNHKNTPNEKIMLAIRKSISIPGVFVPYRTQIPNTSPPEYDVYIDGGLLDNFSIQLFPDSPSTLGLYFTDTTCEYPITGPESFIFHIFYSVFNSDTKRKIPMFKKSNLVYINPCNQSGFNFYLSLEKKKELYQSGYQAIVDHFKLPPKTKD